MTERASLMVLPPDASQTCLACGSKCCTKRETVVVFPTEVDAFKAAVPGAAAAIDVRTGPGGLQMHTLKQRDDGRCVFLEASGACGIYAQRPLECRVFPVVHDFLKKQPFFVAREYCPLAPAASYDRVAITEQIETLRQALEPAWLAWYDAL